MTTNIVGVGMFNCCHCCIFWLFAWFLLLTQSTEGITTKQLVLVQRTQGGGKDVNFFPLLMGWHEMTDVTLMLLQYLCYI